MNKRDYYEVLGLAKNAAESDIKASYRRLASKHHPDKVQDASEKTAAEIKFKEAKEAYETLIDPTKRAQYDQFGHSTPGAHNPTQEDLAEIFKTFFTHGHNFNGDIFNQRPRHPTFIINISLVDAYIGRQVTIDSKVVINIPKGVRSGTKFFVDNKFYLVEIQPHFKFKRSNDDLLVDLQISAIEAMLGVSAVLEHLDGINLQFNIPEGIQTGQIVKLSNRGMRNPETDKVGDMLVRIAVVIPRNLTDSEKTIIKTLQHRESVNV